MNGDFGPDYAGQCRKRYAGEKRDSYMLAEILSFQDARVAVGDILEVNADGAEVTLSAGLKPVGKAIKPFDSLIGALCSFGEELYATVFSVPAGDSYNCFFAEIFIKKH